MPPTTDLNTIGGPEFDVGLQGDLAGYPGSYDILPCVNENATALDFGDVACAGVAAVPGALMNVKPMASGAVVVGITVRSRTQQGDSTGAFKFTQYSHVPVLKIGYIWAKAAEGVTAEDACIGVVASPGAVGGATGGVANSTTRLAFPAGWTWKHTVTTGNIGLIRAASAS